jgi:hypothetical protein
LLQLFSFFAQAAPHSIGARLRRRDPREPC